MNITKAGAKNGGLAKIEISRTQPKVRVTVQADGDKPEKVYVIDKENCPPYVQGGMHYIRLNSDGTKLYSMIPAEPGVFELKVKEFYHLPDKEPAPITKTGNNTQGSYSFQTFMVLFEVVSGPYTGMVIPSSYSYNFVPVKMGDKDFTDISHPKSRFTAKLIEFLTVTGLIKENIPWKENLLPGFQRYVAQKNPKFSGMIRNGFIDSLF